MALRRRNRLMAVRAIPATNGLSDGCSSDGCPPFIWRPYTNDESAFFASGGVSIDYRFDGTKATVTTHTNEDSVTIGDHERGSPVAGIAHQENVHPGQIRLHRRADSRPHD